MTASSTLPTAIHSKKINQQTHYSLTTSGKGTHQIFSIHGIGIGLYAISFRFRGDVMIIEVLHFSHLSDSSRSSNHMVDPFWLPTTGVTDKVLKSFKVMRSGLVTVVCQDLEIAFTIFYRIWRVL